MIANQFFEFICIRILITRLFIRNRFRRLRSNVENCLKVRLDLTSLMFVWGVSVSVTSFSKLWRCKSLSILLKLNCYYLGCYEQMSTVRQILILATHINRNKPLTNVGPLERSMSNRSLYKQQRRRRRREKMSRFDGYSLFGEFNECRIRIQWAHSYK